MIPLSCMDIVSQCILNHNHNNSHKVTAPETPGSQNAQNEFSIPQSVHQNFYLCWFVSHLLVLCCVGNGEPLDGPAAWRCVNGVWFQSGGPTYTGTETFWKYEGMCGGPELACSETKRRYLLSVCIMLSSLMGWNSLVQLFYSFKRIIWCAKIQIYYILIMTNIPLPGWDPVLPVRGGPFSSTKDK